MLTSSPHLTKGDKKQAEWKLKAAGRQKEIKEKLVPAQEEINKLLPHQGTFIEKHYFEEDETYSIYSMYALFHGKDRLSPWYYRAEHLAHWVKPNKHSLIAFIALKMNLHAQRPPNEPWMRKAP
ncbi:MAG: hypothetical protein GQ553_04480 [Nitrosomonadaceae bacterium]|nr:hypothetical protein [Nitrosomonadaceae bacterium]